MSSEYPLSAGYHLSIGLATRSGIRERRVQEITTSWPPIKARWGLTLSYRVPYGWGMGNETEGQETHESRTCKLKREQYKQKGISIR